ncbi:DUF2889 domain-containing protein [Variovorax rhizosphaerae]|uniref:DUF2889 domain-containing protein n=1 Tax=Variovorax rhizosphaerae TaxID=1836200 RepID=A0ABU8WUM0_9BURK
MPLSQPATRRELHHRIIDMRAYARDDGLYDVEAHLVDTKPCDFVRISSSRPVPAGQALHDLWIRMTVDGNYTVQAIEAASDMTPYGICKEAENTLSVLVGERLAKGWSSKVKERLRGAASCTHLMEMLIPLATTALQGIRGADPKRLEKASGPEAEVKLDSCYAYGRSREVVRRFWPQHY